MDNEVNCAEHMIYEIAIEKSIRQVLSQHSGSCLDNSEEVDSLVIDLLDLFLKEQSK